jgi:hypothetical protein
MLQTQIGTCGSRLGLLKKPKKAAALHTHTWRVDAAAQCGNSAARRYIHLPPHAAAGLCNQQTSVLPVPARGRDAHWEEQLPRERQPTARHQKVGIQLALVQLHSKRLRLKLLRGGPQVEMLGHDATNFLGTESTCVLCPSASSVHFDGVAVVLRSPLVDAIYMVSSARQCAGPPAGRCKGRQPCPARFDELVSETLPASISQAARFASRLSPWTAPAGCAEPRRLPRPHQRPPYRDEWPTRSRTIPAPRREL